MTLGELQSRLQNASAYRVIVMISRQWWYVEARCLGGAECVGRGSSLLEAIQNVLSLLQKEIPDENPAK